MSDVRFTIVVPTYNRAHRIAATIEAVIAQSFSDWELIIIDDGSTDNTKEVVSKYSDPRIKYFWQENQERSAARNNGIEKAQGEFVCFLDSDDVWRRNHLETLHHAILKNENLPALYFTGMCWNFPDRKQDIIFETPEGSNPLEYVIKNQIAPSTACIHASILKKHRFNTKLIINEDVELFSRIVSEYPIFELPVITVDFMIHPESTKYLKKDFVLARIKAMNLIFNNPQTGPKISSSFKKWVTKALRHQLIHFYEESGNFGKMNQEIIRFLFSYPADPQNKSKIVLLLYHLPGGNILKSVIRKIK